MAATFSYYYTVDTYVKWSTIVDSDQAINGMEQVVFNDYTDSGMPDWILVHPESSSTTVSKHTIQKGFQIKWRVRFYCKKVDGSTTTWYWLADDAVSNVHANFGAYNGKVSNSNPAVSTVSGSTAFVTPNATVVQNPTGGKVFTFWLNTTQSNFVMSPAFVLTADIQINTTDLLSKYGGDTNSTVQHATLLGVNPIFTVYDAKPVPSVTPPSLLSALQSFSGSGLQYSYAFDRCQNDWYGVAVSPTTTTNNGIFSYSFQVVTCKANGTGLQKSSVVKEKISGNITASNIGPQLAAIRKKLQQVILADCSSQAGSNVSGSNVGDPGTGGSGGGTSNDSITDVLRWNPPTHRYSRDIPLSLRLMTNDIGQGLEQTSGISVDPAAISALQNNPLIKNFTSLEKGRLFQDIAGAQTLNKNPDKIKSISALKGPKQWGFRFMYNPTTFNYSTSSNNAVDWTFGSKDPATLLAGNQNVSIQLYLNRIPDMAYLTRLAYGFNDYNISQETAYGRKLFDEEVQGILNRGTEYDIEFIYRVLNGDPVSKSLLFSTNYKGDTADFGYTTATPCWLVLNDNLRYYGSVAGMSVNHIMFDLNMVPILSIVDIQFSRYPALWTDPAAGGYSRSDLKSKLNPNIIGTPTKAN